MQNTDKKPFENKQEKKNFSKRNDKRQPRREKEVDPIASKLVDVNRVTKVVKGGRTMRFSALVVVGDKAGKVGLGQGKAAEVPNAIDKATSIAKKRMVAIALEGTTIPHEVIGRFGTSMVKLLPAKEGTGVIAGGAARAVLELAGVKDIVSKSLGSNTKVNVAKATLEALKMQKTPAHVAALRGKKVEEL